MSGARMTMTLSAKTRRALAFLPVLLLTGCPVEDRSLDYGALSAGSSRGVTYQGDDGGAGGEGGGKDFDSAGQPSDSDGGAALVGGTGNRAGGNATTGGITTSGGTTTTGGIAPSGGTSPLGGASTTGGAATTGGVASTAGAANISGAANGGTSGSAGSAGTGGKPDDGPCGDIDQNGVQDCQETVAKNPTFDADANSWDAELNLTEVWKSDDARGTHGSGSLSVTFTTGTASPSWASSAASQCLPAWGETEFELGARAYIPAGQAGGNAQISLAIFGNDDCAGSFMGTTTPALSAEVGSWQVLHSSVKLPAGARSVLVRLITSKPGSQASLQVSFDDVLFREKK
jgi:hypothetical protein